MIIEQEKLDDLEAIKILDPSNMWERMKTVPEQMISAGKQVSELAFPAAYRNARAIVFAGMGGSAVAGDFVQSVLESRQVVVWGRRPIFVVSRSSSLPMWVDETTLVFISSYSGNTGETLACFDAAVERSAMIVVLTSGGKLHEKAMRAGVPIFDLGRFIHQEFPEREKIEPRTTVMTSFIGTFGVLCDLGLVFGSEVQLELPFDTIKLAEYTETLISKYVPSTPIHVNSAKQLAIELAGKIVVIYGSGELNSVARRWKNQINENADSWAFSETLPEANHNSVNGYRLENMKGKLEVVLLGASSDNDGFTKRAVVKQLFQDKGISVRSILKEELEQVSQAESFDKAFPVTYGSFMRPIEEILAGTCLGDWVSYYMALLIGVDPSPVPHITALKDARSTPIID